MQNYFDYVDRRGTNCVKWDERPDDDLIPMWVADMDFRVAPCIVEALHRRVEHGVFGYVRVPESYYESVIGWFTHRHGWTFRREWMLYTTGVVPASSLIIKALTRPGDKVLIQEPVYNHFFPSIENNGCVPVSSNLIYKDGTYTIDFEDFERKASSPDVKLFMLCNPHNPAGRVWKREELQRLGEICLRHNVFVLADEIHCDLMRPGFRHTPFASICDEFLQNSVTCNSASKTFNIAGLQIANIIAANPDVRAKIDQTISANELCYVNPFGIEAVQAAYRDGEEWLDQLLLYIDGNYRFLCQHIAEKHPQLRVTQLEGTYLAWLDCKALGKSSQQLEDEIYAQQHVWFTAGSAYGAAGEGFLRVNLACPRQQLQEALRRLDAYLE